MSSQQQFKAGEAKGHVQETTEQWIESAKERTNAACDKTADSAQSAKESAREDSSTGIIQQTAEQMMNMAQGAVDTVKNAINK